MTEVKQQRQPSQYVGCHIDRLLTIEDLEYLLSLHRRMYLDGILPKPVRIGGSYRWKVTDIEETINSLYTDSDLPIEAHYDENEKTSATRIELTQTQYDGL